MLRSALAIFLVLLLTGCCPPNQANIDLRKRNQELQDQIGRLESEKNAALARIQGLESRTVMPTTQGTLSQLYTVHAIKLGPLSSAGPRVLKLYFNPQDQDGEAAKATGTLSIDAIDLADPANRVLGHWDLSPADLHGRWRSLGPLHAFVLELPWQSPPPATQVGVKLKFEDALTSRAFYLLEKVAWDPSGAQ
jgi:hypothetical protein